MWCMSGLEDPSVQTQTLPQTLLIDCGRDDQTHHYRLSHDVLDELKVITKLLGLSAGALGLFISMETEELRVVLELALFQDYNTGKRNKYTRSGKKNNLETDNRVIKGIDINLFRHKFQNISLQ